MAEPVTVLGPPSPEPSRAHSSEFASVSSVDRLVPLAVAVVTALVFLPALRNGFVEWDDYALLVNNPAYRGLSWRQLEWMLTTVLLGHYVPVTWLSFGLDYVVWGMNPLGYHLTNLVLHAANGVLLYLVAERLLGRATAWPGAIRRIGALAGALFFALHPLRAESVAWATGRRDVLSGLFFLLAILCYLRACEAVEGRRRGWLAASVLAYALALLSKATVLPTLLVLVLLDVYPLGRLPADPRQWLGRSARPVWIEKVPYALCGLAGGLTAYRAAAVGANAVTLAPATWLAVTFQTLWFHVHKTLVPVGLSPLYEIPPGLGLREPWVLVSAVGVLGLTVVALSLWRVWPALLAAWIYYGLMLAPVMGFAHAGPQLTADRYSYLAGLGWAVLVAAGAGLAARAVVEGGFRPVGAASLAGVAMLALVALGALTWRQVQVWHDTERLWSHAVRVTPGCARCRVNLGATLLARQEYGAAISEFERARVLRPTLVQIHGNIAVALVALGRFAEAVPHYRRVLAQFPDTLEVRVNLANALLQLGRLPEVVEELRRATRGHPSAAGAAAYFLDAVEAKPEAPVARLGLMEAYLALGKPDLARAQFVALQRLDPALAEAAADELSRGL